MADFVVLPSTALVGKELAQLVQPFLPTVPIRATDCLVFLLHLANSNSAETMVVFQDDLPTSQPLLEALRDGYGATAEDRVTLVKLTIPTEVPNIQHAPMVVGIPTMTTRDSISTR